jgi:3-hydroxyisobutyrate dehydrogenase-like beta-hydroxyacid dehydrogenase
MAEIVGLLHPGEMGAAVGAELKRAGKTVLWASEGRSEATRARAEEAGLDELGTVDELRRSSEVILSICPPHAALDVAHSVAGFEGLYLDANAVAPATVREITGLRCVDGGIVGAPPRHPTTTHLYLSGPDAPAVAELFDGTGVVCRVVSDEVGAASALKLAYAAWTKGTAALLLAIDSFARTEGVSDALSEEWHESLPHLSDALVRAERSAAAKGWRWVGEMEEIAAAFQADDLPRGFHEAAAEVFRAWTPEWQRGVPS